METASQGTSVKSVDAFTTTAGNTGLQAYRKDAVDFGSDEGASLTVIEKRVPPSSLHAKRQFKSKKQKSSMGYDLSKGKTPNKPIMYIYQYIIMLYTQNTTYCMYIEICGGAAVYF